ncbi:MAG TPA: type II toxin-antitoxin system VapC family toxin [Mycobacteriales bacterium]|nr:type II toxin-antitoxin system VapC family toxin [Mycobacteriales bacterium]
MTLYLDTSALAKLLVVEAETPALRAYLRGRRDSRRVACGLVRAELRRVAVRLPGDLLPAAERLLKGLVLVPVDDALLDTAGTLGPAVPRTLDAVHLAAALRVAPVDALVTYDDRMADAATGLGLQVVAPS